MATPGKNRPHRRRLGLFAPTAAISQAHADAEGTTRQRARQRVVNTRHRDKAEAAYRAQFESAVVAWLEFTPEHADVAVEIARAAAERAVVVGSGRVGRTRSLPLEERAALAARATIRHRFTDYDDQLVGLDPDGAEVDDSDYRVIKRGAHDAVDHFLSSHRPPAASASSLPTRQLWRAVVQRPGVRWWLDGKSEVPDRNAANCNRDQPGQGGDNKFASVYRSQQDEQGRNADQRESWQILEAPVATRYTSTARREAHRTTFCSSGIGNCADPTERFTS